MHPQERRYDANRRMSLLVEDWVSAANALQRKGRAGRVRAGHCFGLYTRARFEQRMRKFQVCAPESSFLHFLAPFAVVIGIFDTYCIILDQ